MTADQIGALVDGAIPFLGGLYVTLLSFRIVGKKLGKDDRCDHWHERFGGVMKIVGPLLMIFGVFRTISSLGT